MILVGLLAFKNEEQYLPDCLKQLTSICDIVLGHDDFSTDKSASIFKEFGGVLIPNCRSLPWGNGGEFQVRDGLLKSGRLYGGTHFICLDADELFSPDIVDNVRPEIERLTPGRALCYRWINCWASDGGDELLQDVANATMKDFSFADDELLNYTYGEMHISRTPTMDSQKSQSVLDGGVLHLQYTDFTNFVAKQFWYELSEIIYSKHPYYYVDYKYLRHMRRPRNLTTQESLSTKNLVRNLRSEALSETHRLQIMKLLESVNKEQVSHLKLLRYFFLKELYVSAYGSEPPKQNFFNSIKDSLLLVQFVIRSRIARWKSQSAE